MKTATKQLLIFKTKKKTTKKQLKTVVNFILGESDLFVSLFCFPLFKYSIQFFNLSLHSGGCLLQEEDEWVHEIQEFQIQGALSRCGRILWFWGLFDAP